MPHMLGAVCALTSAVAWGSADFSGGMATRRSHHFQVVALSALAGLVLLTALAAIRGEGIPPPASRVWAALAGATGAIGLAALYRGLALGNTALVAPTAAVVGALVPVLFGMVRQGLPDPAQLAGFAVGIGGIWLVTGSASASMTNVRQGLLLAILAGLGFGGFFVMLAQVDQGTVFSPLVITKAVSLVIAVAILMAQRLSVYAPGSTAVAVLAGVLDAGGNVFYLLARQLTRLDVAVVLGSMYPAATVILAGLILHERINRHQWLGVVLCVLAVALIVL